MRALKLIKTAIVFTLILSFASAPLAQEFSAPIAFHRSQILTSAEVILAIQNDSSKRSVESIEGMVGYIHLQSTAYSLLRDARELEVLLKLYDFTRLVPDAKNSDFVNRTLSEQIDRMQKAVNISLKNIESAIVFAKMPEAVAALLTARDRSVENQKFINSLSPQN